MASAAFDWAFDWGFLFLHDQIKKEAEERDAMTRMSELYTKNPNLGDAAPLVHRLAENQKNLDGLQVELTKFQVFGIVGSQRDWSMKYEHHYSNFHKGKSWDIHVFTLGW